MSPPENAPVALQWEIEIPALFAGASTAGPQTGEASKRSGKSVTCAGKWKDTAVLYTYVCVVAGGRDRIADGVIAFLPIVVPSNTPRGRRVVRINRAQAVAPDLRKIAIRNAEGTITVTP